MCNKLNSNGAEAPNSESALPNVQAQRWTWLAKLCSAERLTDMAIRCSAWLGCIFRGSGGSRLKIPADSAFCMSLENFTLKCEPSWMKINRAHLFREDVIARCISKLIQSALEKGLTKEHEFKIKVWLEPAPSIQKAKNEKYPWRE